MTPEEVEHAILTEDELSFKQVKGIGAKTAKQIILDLKNKVSRSADQTLPLPKVRDNTLQQEALSALAI